jgi:5-methylcytosine-specific restriction enzyme A
MPSAPKRPCGAAGCSELVTRGRCAEPARQERAHHERFSRDRFGRRLYASARWRARRRIFLEANRWCIDCAAENRRVLATDVDHLDRHFGDEHTFWDESRWRAR